MVAGHPARDPARRARPPGRAGPPGCGSSGYWTERIDEAESSEPGRFDRNGWVVTALQAAWSAIVHTPVPTDAPACRHLLDSLDTAIRIGDDTDTVAAIAGALLGARWGASAVPAQWRRILARLPGYERRAARRAGPPGRQQGSGDLRLAAGRAHRLLELVRGTDTRPAPVRRWRLARRRLGARRSAGRGHRRGEPLPGRPRPDPARRRARRLPAHRPSRPGSRTPTSTSSWPTPPALSRRCATRARVLVHCVAAHSRTPSVGIAYAMLRGVDRRTAIDPVCARAARRAPERRVPGRAETAGPCGCPDVSHITATIRASAPSDRRRS